MNNSHKYRLGAMPRRFFLPSVSLSLRVGALVLYGASALLSTLVRAEPPPIQHPPTVTPLDNEQDLQKKLRLQEKISRELEENKKRIAEQKKEHTQQQRSTPSEISEDTGDPSQ